VEGRGVNLVALLFPVKGIFMQFTTRSTGFLTVALCVAMSIKLTPSFYCLLLIKMETYATLVQVWFLKNGY
jgi:hypothetical protein